MLKIGITGGIGSGKSTACRLFALYGIPIYDADSEARKLMTEHAPLVKALKKYFGNHIYDAQGALIRPALAQQVFNNKQQLDLLNSLVHPVTLQHHLLWHKKQKNAPYTLKEAALLFESGSYKNLDKIIVVTAPEELRITRAMQRDGSTRQEVLNRLRNQLSEAERKKRADYLLYNDQAHSLINQVAALHQKLCALAAG